MLRSLLHFTHPRITLLHPIHNITPLHLQVLKQVCAPAFRHTPD